MQEKIKVSSLGITKNELYLYQNVWTYLDKIWTLAVVCLV